jgi:osmotically-inducible protein OsmY
MDWQLSESVRSALLSDPRAYLAHVDVTVYRGVAVLGGLVFDPESRQAAVKAAARVDGVQSVTDFIQISGNAR